MSALPDIYSFNDYRAYLLRVYTTMKAQQKSFSYARYAKMMGVASPNYLKLVIDGERNLTITNIHRFAKGLGLISQEVAYFETLVLLNQGQSAAETAYYRRRLKALKNEAPTRVKRAGKIEEKWIGDIIPVWICLEKVAVDAAASRVQRLTGFSREKTEEIIRYLLTSGLISIEEDHYRLHQDYFLIHDTKASSASKKNALRRSLQESQKRLESEYEKGAKFFSHAFTLSAEEFDRVVERIQNFLIEITEEADRTPVERIGCLNIQFFRMKS